MENKPSFVTEEGFELSLKEVQTLENEIRGNKHFQQGKQRGQSRKKGKCRLFSWSGRFISLDGFGKEVKQGSGNKILLLVRRLGSK